MGDKYKNIPPKDIQNILWGMLDYRDFDERLSEEGDIALTVRDYVYNAWNLLHWKVKQNPEWFMKWIEEHEPDVPEL